VGSPSRLPAWFTDIGRWQQELRAELATLPETLRLLREAVANMQVVTKRLVDATAALEQLTAASAVMADAQRRFDDLAASLRLPLGGDQEDRVRRAVDDARDAINSIARLNPLWPRAKPPTEG